MVNELRRRSLRRTVNLDKNPPPEYNFDDSHRVILNELITGNGPDAMTQDERRVIWRKATHNLVDWLNSPALLPKLRVQFICVLLTILSFMIVIDTAKPNNFNWDVVFPVRELESTKPCP